jgi:predicted  nucleic acid-binding Zn-ribbon protein
VSEPRSERPVGARPESERSDWTEQDLLTIEEALPRLRDAIAEAEAEAAAVTDPDQRDLLERRIAAMYEARKRLESR